MKKIILIFLFVFCLNVKAMPTTYERTNDNLRIHDTINVNSYKKNHILKTPAVNENEKVYDFAELLTETEENNLYNKVVKFISTYNMDLALVTINDNWTDAETYADNFYVYNYFGIGNTFDGILLLIDMDTREIWLSTNGEAILIYNDYRIESILDDMYYYIQDAKYYETFNAGIEKASEYATKGIPEENKNSFSG